MARLRWKSVLSSGAHKLHDNRKNQYLNFTLSVAPVDSAAALLILAAKDVSFEKNFITINQPNQVPLDDISKDAADNYDWYVSRILSTSDRYTVQIHRIKPGQLEDGQNSLGIHARAENGTTVGNIDDFSVARIFLLYTSVS